MQIHFYCKLFQLQKETEVTKIYKIANDSLANIFNGFLGNRPQTFDRHHDQTINEPYESKYTIKDVNKDGFNDIIFSGKVVFIAAYSKNIGWYDAEEKNGKTVTYSEKNTWKKIPITFVFIYDTKSEHFVEQEDYSKKYEYNFGNTK